MPVVPTPPGWTRCLADLADLVLPRACVGCGRPGGGLCEQCGMRLPVATARVADLVGVPVAAAAPYADGLRAGVLAFKERGRRDLAGPLGALLAAAVRSLDADPAAVLVPVPSTSEARRARGVDHVRVLAAAAGRRCGRRVSRPLSHTRATRDSAGLDVAERAANALGALRARPPERRRGAVSAVVVDDIVTTGATLAEAVRALRAQGWDVSGAAVVAATVLRRSHRPASGRPGTETTRRGSCGDTWGAGLT